MTRQSAVNLRIYLLGAAALGLACLAEPAWAAWSHTQWRVKPVRTPAANPGWVFHRQEPWKGTSGSVQPVVDGQFAFVYRRPDPKGKAKFQEMQVTPLDLSRVRLALENASQQLSEAGFQAPLVKSNYGFWEAHLFPDDYVYDGSLTSPDDKVWGLYVGLGSGGQTSSGVLYVARDWERDPGVAFIHELFHGVQSGYSAFSGSQADISSGCPEPCWLREGMSEGFAAYWAQTRGKALLKQPYAPRSTRSFEQALATGSATQADYRTGQQTSRFWNYVAHHEKWGAWKAVLEQPSVSENQGLTAVDKAFQSTGLGGLTPVYVRFAARELKAPADFKTPVTFDLHPDDTPRVKKKLAFPPLATRALRIRFQTEKDSDAEVTIKAPPAHADTIHILHAGQAHKGEVSLPMRQPSGKYDFYVTVAHAHPQADQTQPKDIELEVSVAVAKCGMMPAAKVQRLEYEQRDGKQTKLADIRYDFAKSRRTPDGRIVDVDLDLRLYAQDRVSTSRSKMSFRCEKGHVIADGGYDLLGLDLGPNGVMGRASGNLQIKQVQNTLSLPNDPQVDMRLPNGSSVIQASLEGAPAIQISTQQSNRRIVAQQNLTVAGAGNLACWKMSADHSFNLSFNAQALVGDPKTPGTQAVTDYMGQLQGGGMPADVQAQMQSLMMSELGRGVMQQALGTLGSALSQQAQGTVNTWFAPGIGLVKSEQITPAGTSTLLLTRVTYR
ncbi:MAG: hypothetical protein ACO1RX_10310 [Candidatus Sericytochromatia bacterium]